MIRQRNYVALRLALVVTTLLALAGAALAPAQDLEEQLDGKRAELDRAQQREGVQSSTLQSLSTQIEEITAEVALLHNREAAVEAELAEAEARLAAARDDLVVARERLRRASAELRQQLVSIYKSTEPDVLAVILDSEGFDDLLGRSEYLSSIQNQGEAITDRVRDLRDQTLGTVETISATRDEIAAQEAELEETREQLEAREAALADARGRERDALARTRTEIGALQGDVSDLEEEIQAELQAAQEAATPEASGGVAPVAAPADPDLSESSSGLIWPVEGSVTSPFGPRWGSVHAGIDIGASEGTPIMSADAGQVVMAGWSGGYGNYTCIDHGGGLSTCYAHQSSIGVSIGQEVSQGEVIGAVGNTGNSFGAHLHFETRVNGVPQDPLGYL